MKIQATAEVMKVTPEMASQMLTNRCGEQRGVRKAHVLRLASDMEAGRFRAGPDAILLVKGKLANGQHRLEAVVHCGKPQTFLVMQSNDDDLYKVIDAGLRRTASDSLIGVSYAKEIPSIARWVMSYNNKTVFPSVRDSVTAAAKRVKHTGTTTRQAISQAELIEYCLDNHELLSKAASFSSSLYSQTKLLRASICGALYVIGHTANKAEQMEEFLRRVYTKGGDDAAGDLRNRLTADMGSRAKLPAGYVFGICVKAFKAYCDGLRANRLQWSACEDLPQI